MFLGTLALQERQETHVKDVKVTELPPCDNCNSPGCGVYNSPTRNHGPFAGRWGNFCGPCFRKYGIDTSVTERRVLPPSVPGEVKAMMKHWGDSDSVAVKGAKDKTWRFDGGGYQYLVHEPGVEVDTFEVDGRPTGSTVFHDDWAVRCLNDAPDAWWTIALDGTYQAPNGKEVKVW